MSKIVLQINREVPGYREIPIWRYFFGDSLKKALSDSCEVSLEVDGQIIAGPNKTNWGSSLSQSALLAFLRNYRDKPGDTRPVQSVREGLHSFLFAQGSFEQQVIDTLARDVAARERSEIIIRGDASSLPLIVNIPWELTQAPRFLEHPRRPALIGTLAAGPLARTIPNTKAELLGENERLRVLYCISQPLNLVSIKAERFHRAFEDALQARTGMLRFEAVINNDFKPTFNQLKAGLERMQPHVLLVVGHGKTTDGVTQLCFEKWQPVSALADAIGEKRRTFLVVLVACDQTHLAENPAAESGAVTLLQEGVLATVAMQSSVSTLLAREFIGTTLDWFFQNGSIGLAVAEGRKSMAPTAADAERIVDWSFPSLVLAENAADYNDELIALIAAYLPTLDEMLRRIPQAHRYLPRPDFDESLLNFMRVGVAGLRVVTGGAWTGKSTTVQHACRRTLEHMIERNDTTARPILYVDFDRYTESPMSARELMELLRKQSNEIQSTAAGTPLLSWSSARGADGDAGTADPLGQLVAFIDFNRMVLVLDNLRPANGAFWLDFFERVKDLKDSLVIRIQEVLETGSEADLEIVAFTQEQTAQYVESFAPQHAAASGDWFSVTGGLPGLLDLLRKSNGDKESVQLNAAALLSGLSVPEQNVLFALANLANGVDLELADVFLQAESRELFRLAQKGLLHRESRFGITSSWFRVSGMLMRTLKNDGARTTEAAVYLANRFREQVGQSSELSPTEFLASLAAQPGGIDFIHDVHQIVVTVEEWDQAHALPLLLHKTLLDSGRWYEALRLWRRLLDAAPFEETEAQEWLKLAKLAHILGFGNEADTFIELANQRNPGTLDRIDARIQIVTIIKDSGDKSRSVEVTELFDEIMGLIDAAQTENATGSVDEFTAADVLERQALALHNRALHRRYWLRDLENALSDLDRAGALFNELGDVRMKALTDLEWAEIQIDWAGTTKDWQQLLGRLMLASATFESVGAQGDNALCYYHVARCFRRMTGGSSGGDEMNLAKARDSYRRAAELAEVVGDTRLSQIAKGRLVEISWHKLHEMNAGEAAMRFKDVVDVLKTYEGDAWSSRVVRDMLRLRAIALREAEDPNAIESYKAAWAAAVQAPLHPDYGQDAKETARIFLEYLGDLENSGQTLEADRMSFIAQGYIEAWLERTIDPSSRENWIDDVRKLSS